MVIVRTPREMESLLAELRLQAAEGTKNLEDIFLELTGAYELQGIIRALRQDTEGHGDR